MDKSLAKLKQRQLVCENSHELREFERQLMSAYNKLLLDAKIAADRTEQKRQQALEKQIAEAEKYRFRCEEERLKLETERKRQEELRLASKLMEQMAEKQTQLEADKNNALKEYFEIEKKVEEEQAKEKQLQEIKENEKVQLRKEQTEFQKWQQEIIENRKQHQLAEEKKFVEEATYFFEKDLKDSEERKKRIEAFEVVKESLAQQLIQIAKLQQEKDEIRERLMCIEKEEQEQKRSEQEELRKIRGKELAKQIYLESTNRKKLSWRETANDDIYYANYIKTQIEADQKREEEILKIQKQERQVLRSQNEYLIGYRKERKDSELQRERAIAEADEVARKEKEEIVKEERIRLLSSLEPELLEMLPRGSLSEEDKLCLNTYRANKTFKASLHQSILPAKKI